MWDYASAEQHFQTRGRSFRGIMRRNKQYLPKNELSPRKNSEFIHEGDKTGLECGRK